ncbi:MAG: OmpH family outer membrane protein [Acidobacteriota bacterium]|nr:OmpH family outer membrane protein [Acidobacteriota bacterium]
MKNRLIAFSALLAFLAVPLAAHAQGKIGVINMNAAIASTAEGKKAMADLQKKYVPRQQELERLQREIQSDQEKLTKQGPTLSEEEQGRLTREMEDKQKLLKRSTDDAQSEFNTDRDEAVRRIGIKVVRIIGEYSQQNGIALVLDAVQVPIYFATKDIDLTEPIIKRYDAANPVADAGAPAATHPVAPSPVKKPK